MRNLIRSTSIINTLVALIFLAGPGMANAVCVGDCNGDGEVTVDELLIGVNIALGTANLSACSIFDANGDGEVTVDELLTAVNNLLNGCSMAAGTVGAACTANTDCVDGTCFDTLPGGYCTRVDCLTNGCPSGSTCFNTTGGGSACYKTCTSPSDCRQAEGYTCDAENTCYVSSSSTPTPTPGAGLGRVGDACTADADCTDNSCFNTLPGGYCTRMNCGALGCPAGSSCFDLTGGGTACYKTCTLPSQCRVAEGYTCDADNTCYVTTGPTPTPRPNLQPVGAACSADIECADAWCFTDLPGGYCTRVDCDRLGCPGGSACFNLVDGGSGCYKSCTSAAQCRQAEGYICDSENTCYVP